MRMQYRDWPELQRKVSAIALGSAHFGAKMPEETVFEVMDAYIKLGGNVLDTARIYGDFDLGIPGISEKTIGKWLASRKKRDDLVISTKGAHPPWGEFLTPRLDRKSIESDMEESLEALGVPGVELYFLHRDDVNRPVADILESLNGLLEKGKVKLLGASNWSAARILEANAYASSHGLQGFGQPAPVEPRVPAPCGGCDAHPDGPRDVRHAPAHGNRLHALFVPGAGLFHKAL